MSYLAIGTDFGRERPHQEHEDARGERPHELEDGAGVEVGRQFQDVRGGLSASRLQTLVGPSGVGKTRLALRVARFEIVLPFWLFTKGFQQQAYRGEPEMGSGA